MKKKAITIAVYPLKSGFELLICYNQGNDIIELTTEQMEMLFSIGERVKPAPASEMGQILETLKQIESNTCGIGKMGQILETLKQIESNTCGIGNISSELRAIRETIYNHF